MKPRKRYTLRFRFDDGGQEALPAAAAELQLLLQSARMIDSGEPDLAVAGRAHLQEAAQILAAYRCGKLDGASRSARSRQAGNVERDRRIHDAHRRGELQKTIAADEGISGTTVSRVLGRPRP